ncbi:ectoine/hydroxyectoine ABC transporter, permease protein EhuD [Klebsiella michiganensis]|uniref:Ectoine/hydroxyectoine ABC transporter, permease protein EhuD n=1 Tax=Klebsiella michiganensis TaxID=1134687 RepID=A0A7H4PRE7_9ENTR|nr:ectoine/hydroxyectoine ABC transporter, permease protein EhuD [Klebsiella michiganensis]
MNFFDWQYTWEIFPLMMQASIKTIYITLTSGYVIALVLGLFLAMARRSGLPLAGIPGDRG